MVTREGTPSLKELDNLAREICDCWKSLGHQLDVDPEEIKNISLDNVQYNNVVRKAFAMLEKWYDKGSSSTYEALALGLKKVQKQALVEKYCLSGCGKPVYTAPPVDYHALAKWSSRLKPTQVKFTTLMELVIVWPPTWLELT